MTQPEKNIAVYYSLIVMLFNTNLKRWHPMVYFEAPFPGPLEDQKVLRLKSKMHHTTGFKTREEALESAEKLKNDVKENTLFGKVMEELEFDMLWGGMDLPVDIMIRPFPKPEELK
jgi:hypothetical protein